MTKIVDTRYEYSLRTDSYKRIEMFSDGCSMEMHMPDELHARYTHVYHACELEAVT